MSRGGMPGTLSESIVTILSDAKGDLVPRDKLHETIYGCAPDAPLNERRALNRTISNLRARGFAIECVVAFRLRQP